MVRVQCPGDRVEENEAEPEHKEWGRASEGIVVSDQASIAVVKCRCVSAEGYTCILCGVDVVL